jgi:hypothetical protein
LSFFSAFTGSAQRRDLRRANTQATQALDKGYGEAMGRYDQAAGMFDPYVQEGRAGSQFYSNALGLNGEEARNQAQGVITSDPMWSGKLAQDQNAMMKYMNARGQSGGGMAAMAGQRLLLDNYNNALNRYNDLGQQGFQATGAQAGIRQGQGDAAYGFGATKAGQSINYGNAMAQARGIGVNNLLGVAGAGLNAFNTFRK